MRCVSLLWNVGDTKIDCIACIGYYKEKVFIQWNLRTHGRFRALPTPFASRMILEKGVVW